MKCTGCDESFPAASDQYYKHVKQCGQCSKSDKEAACKAMDKELEDAQYVFQVKLP